MANLSKRRKRMRRIIKAAGQKRQRQQKALIETGVCDTFRNRDSEFVMKNTGKEVRKCLKAERS